MIPSALSAQLQQGRTDFLRYSFWSSTPGMERGIGDFVVESGRGNRGALPVNQAALRESPRRQQRRVDSKYTRGRAGPATASLE